MKLHHIGKVVANLEAEIKYYQEFFGLEKVSGPITDQLQDVRVAFINVGFSGQPTIELIAPLSERSPVYKFLKKGGGWHHLCYEVDNIREAEQMFRAKEAHILRGPVPGAGHGNHLTLWLFTKQGELVELVES